MGTALRGRPSGARASTGTKQPGGAPAGTRNSICSTPLQQTAAAARTLAPGVPPTRRAIAASPTPVPHSVTVSPGAASGLRLAAGSASGAVSLEKNPVLEGTSVSSYGDRKSTRLN